MKNRLLLLLFVLVISALFVACSNETSGKTENEDSTIKQNVDEKEEIEDNNEEKESDQTVEEETESLEDEDETQTEVAEYKVDGIWSIVPLKDANEKVVLLTIDDAPDKHALEMAKTLQELNANAIFFVNGHFLETAEEKEILKEIYDMGFIIGNHTYSHKNLQDISEDEQKEEIVRVNDMVEEITGERPQFFRAPFGANTDYSKELVSQQGMTLMNWSYGYDWERDYMSQEAITDIMINTDLLRNGANLLMHDREWTAAGLSDIVIGLRDKGYEMVDPNLIETIELE